MAISRPPAQCYQRAGDEMGGRPGAKGAPRKRLREAKPPEAAPGV
jgi:hypothetical protein